MEELKKCPFCGGEADIYRGYGKYGFFVVAECVLCGARTKCFSSGKDHEYEENAMKNAIFAWNKRTKNQNE